MKIPQFRPDLLRPLISPAITVAMLGAIESLMSAVVSDRMSKCQHNPNVELVGQGVANIISPLFGGLPATGAIARTATNIRSGAKTPVAGMIHALTLLAIVLFAAPLARFIPLSVLAGILLVVSYNMGDWGEIAELWKLSFLDIGIWLATFSLTVFADLTVAVEIGMILAVLLFIRKVTATTTVSRVTDEYIREGQAHILQHKEIPPYVSHFPDSRAVSVWSHRQAPGNHFAPGRSSSHPDPATAQHDGHRRDGAGCSGGARRCGTRIGAGIDTLRGARTTRPADAPGRVWTARGPGEPLLQRCGGARSGEGANGGSSTGGQRRSGIAGLTRFARGEGRKMQIPHFVRDETRLLGSLILVPEAGPDEAALLRRTTLGGLPTGSPARSSQVRFLLGPLRLSRPPGRPV